MGKSLLSAFVSGTLLQGRIRKNNFSFRLSHMITLRLNFTTNRVVEVTHKTSLKETFTSSPRANGRKSWRSDGCNSSHLFWVKRRSHQRARGMGRGADDKWASPHRPILLAGSRWRLSGQNIRSTPFLQATAFPSNRIRHLYNTIIQYILDWPLLMGVFSGPMKAP